VSSYRPTLRDGWSWRDDLGRGHAESDAAWCRIVERAKQPCVCLDGDVPDDVHRVAWRARASATPRAEALGELVEACIEDFYEPPTCCLGDDSVRIGAWDGSRTRSIWVRLTFMGPTRLCLSETGEPSGEAHGPCVSIELCAGRAGADDYVKILPTDVSDEHSPGNPPIYSLLVGLLKSQMWALEAS
jgi:hypothetical protein